MLELQAVVKFFKICPGMDWNSTTFTQNFGRVRHEIYYRKVFPQYVKYTGQSGGKSGLIR